MVTVSRSSLQIFFAVAILFPFVCSSCITTNLLVKQKIKRQQKKAEIRAAKQAETDPVPQRLPIGFVHMVHPNGEFVLIRSARNFHLEPGSKITTYNLTGSETASLEASAASKGEFITADIVSGKPDRGDRAVANYIPQKRSSGEGDQPTTADGNEDVQVLE